tara:strand:- start:21 stop:134 length:114 start_codon:yes stop_codon:yes gene_type:complete
LRDEEWLLTTMSHDGGSEGLISPEFLVEFNGDMVVGE